MLQSGKQYTRALLLGKHEIDDVHDARHRVPGVAEKFQAHGTHMLRHAVHHPARARDQAVATLLLDAWQATEELVGHIFAQALLAKTAAWDVQSLRPLQGDTVGSVVTQLKRGQFCVMDLAQVVVDPCHFHPASLGCHHAPGYEVVQRRAPQHGLFAAGIHGDIAADARSLSRGRVHGKHISATLGSVGNPLRNHAGFGPDSGNRLGNARKVHQGDLAHRFELLGIDDRAFPGQGTGTPGVTGATTARNHCQAQVDTALDQARHLGLGVRCEYHKRVLDAPVGRVRNVRDTAQTVELDVVLGRQPAELAQTATAQLLHLGKAGIESRDSAPCRFQQGAHHAIARPVKVGGAPLLDFAQAVLQGFHQQPTPFRVIQQIILKIGIALHHPDIAQYLVQHPGRTASTTFIAQLLQGGPCGSAEQADHDLAVRKGGVVIGNFANAFLSGADPARRR